MKKTVFIILIAMYVFVLVSCATKHPTGPITVVSTATATRTQVAATSTHTPTRTKTPDNTATASFSATGTLTATDTGTKTFTPTLTPTKTATMTVTETPTITATGTVTSTITVSPTASISATYTETATDTPVYSPTTTPTALNCSYSGNEVVISQIYGGASSSVFGGSYNYDFVVLHNRSDCAFTMTNWSIQYAAAMGTSISSKFTLNGTIQPGGYYLIRMYGPGIEGSALPAADASTSMSIASNAGMFYLHNQTTDVPLAAYGCPAGTIKDFVGYGGAGGVNCWDGTSPVSSPLINQGCIRKTSGCQDTNSNYNDFTVGIPSPQNSASTAVICP